MKVKRAVRIRISSKRKKQAKELALALARFRNLLVIFQNTLYSFSGQFVLNEGAIYSLLADHLYETGHRVVYVGKGAARSKNGINLGKVANQNSVSISFRTLIDILKVGAKLRKLALDVKVVLHKLYNPLSCNLYDCIYGFKGKAEAPSGIGDSELATAGLAWNRVWVSA